MEQNKEIIEQFKKALEDLDGKVERFKNTRDNAKLDDETKATLDEVITKLEEDKANIELIVTKMEKRNNRGVNPYRESDFEDSKFVSKYNRLNDDLKEVNESIDKLSAANNKLSSLGDNKFAQKVQSKLEKRISAMKEKQGNIQNKQSKIVNKAVKEKLEVLMKNNNRKLDRLDKKIQAKSEKVGAINEKGRKLTEEKEELKEIKDALLADKGLGAKILGAEVKFKEKLTAARIASLKLKKGILNNKEKHVVMRGVKPSLIQRMKEKVSKFGRAVSESFKAGVDTFKSFYEDVSFEEPARSPSR